MASSEEYRVPFEPSPQSVMCFDDCPAVQIVVDLGYSKESVRYAYRKLGRNNPSAVDLLDVLFQKEEHVDEERRESCHVSRELNIQAANWKECERLGKGLAYRYIYKKLTYKNPSAVDELFQREEPVEREKRESCHIQKELNIETDYAKECERLRKKLAHLEKTFACKSCGGNADMCGWPCGHIVFCEKCVTNYCPICKTSVSGAVKTYRV